MENGSLYVCELSLQLFTQIIVINSELVLSNGGIQMTEANDSTRVPCLLWPFWAIWRLVAFIVGLTGRLLAIVLGFVLILAGVVLSVTVVGLIVGIPLILLGALLVIRGLF